MRIVKKMLEPSREDAVRMTRTEKMAMLSMAHAATILDETQDELKNRLGMVERGAERLHALSEGADELLHDIRLTMPEEQRHHLQNTAMDYECRLVPKATPGSTNVIMGKEEFRELVDWARTKCRDCADSDEECTACRLYKLLTSVLPLDEYHNSLLCPYNLGEWGN